MTRYLILTIVIFLLLAGCSEGETNIRTEYANVCYSRTLETRSDFILKCIKNANPMSDEEPEDYIRECKNTATDLYCETKKFKIFETYTGGRWVTTTKREIKGALK